MQGNITGCRRETGYRALFCFDFICCCPCYWLLSRCNRVGLGPARAGATTSLMRETFNVEQWDEMRVEDTPHGFFAKMMGREAGKVNAFFMAVV